MKGSRVSEKGLNEMGMSERALFDLMRNNL
jgi:hypothetical protein